MAIFTFLNTLLPPTAVDSPVKLDLYLNGDEPSVVKLTWFLLLIFCSSI